MPRNNDFNGIIELLNLIYEFFLKLATQKEKTPLAISALPSAAKIIRIINCPLLNRRPDWCLENVRLNLAKGIYYEKRLKEYPIWMIDEAINALPETDRNIITKAYGPSLRVPIPAKDSGVKLTAIESKQLAAIKNKLLSNLKKKSLKNSGENSDTLRINTSAYRELTRVLMENHTGCKDVNSKETKNSIIVFLYLGVGEVQPLSIELIASIYNLTICEVKNIIINTLIKFKDNLQIQDLIEHIIQLLQSNVTDYNKPIEVNPNFRNKHR